MDDGLYLPYLVSRYTFTYLPYLPVRFMDPVCEQGIISKSPPTYVATCSYKHIYRERERAHLRY